MEVYRYHFRSDKLCTRDHLCTCDPMKHYSDVNSYRYLTKSDIYIVQGSKIKGEIVRKQLESGQAQFVVILRNWQKSNRLPLRLKRR